MVNAAGVLSQAKLAKALGLSPAMITKLKGQGMPVHSVAAATAWRQKNQRTYFKPEGHAERILDDAPASADDDDDAMAPEFKVSRAWREAAEAELARIKVKREMGQLIEAAAVRAEWAKQTASVRDSLLSLGARLAPVLATESDPARVQNLIDLELRAALSAFVAE